MKCIHCDTALPDEASFCHSCGSQVSDAEGQARASGAIDESAMQHLERLLKQDTQGEFEIEGMLGRGGMAMVYLATETHLSRKVAIKVLPPELTFGHGVERFKREAKTAAGLDHPNIIPIYRIASGGKVFWYAMKFLEGQSLDELLKEKGQCSLEETIQILMPVADALDYGHLHSVIHRDIKPANIMLDVQNRVIVTDFGIAKALTEGTLTASGSVIGTPFYMSPEQGMGKPVTGAADQYSVAVMTYRMLSGQVPFEGDSAIEILHKHCAVAPPPLDQLLPGLPDYVYRAIEKGLAKKPAQRFSTVKAFVKALREPSPEITVSEEATVLVNSDPSIEDRISTEVITLADTPAPQQTVPTAQPSQPIAQPTQPTAQPAPTVQPTHAPQQEKKKGGIWKVLVPLLIIIAAGGGGGGWWWWTQQNKTAGPDLSQIAQDTGLTGVATATDETPADSTAGTVAETTDSAVEQTPADPVTETDETPVDPTPPPPNPSMVTVTGMLPSGLVLLDGEIQSDHTFQVTPGEEHTIEMRQPGYQNLSQTVTVDAGQRVTIAYTGQPQRARQQTRRPAAPQFGFVLVRVRPSPGGNIFIDESLVESSTTRFAQRIRTGRHRIQVRRDTYVTFDTTVTVSRGDTTRVNVTLRPGGK